MNSCFKLKFPTVLYALLCLVVLLSGAGFLWNVYNLIYFIGVGGFKIVTSALLVAVTGALSVLALSTLFYCRYTVKNKTICLHLGLFKLKASTDDVCEITRFKKSDKLVVYFLDNKFSVVMIDRKDYDDFIVAVRNQNPSVVFDVKIEGEDLPSWKNFQLFIS